MKKYLVFTILLLLGGLGYAQNQNLVNQNWVMTGGSPSAFYDYQASHVDASHNLIVVGNTFHSGQQENMLIRKYNPAGILMWSKEYDGLLSGIDFATDVTTQDTNIFVTGVVGDTATGVTYITTLRLNQSGGIVWTARYSNSSYSGYNIPARISAKTGSSEIFVCGTSQISATGFAMVTMVYSSSGVLGWVNSYDSTGLYNGGADMVQVGTSTVTYGVSGLSTSSGDFVTETILSSGTRSDLTRVNNANSYITQPIGIVKDVSENVYFAGVVQTGIGNTDIKVVKLDSMLHVKWTKTIDGGANKNDAVTAIKIDPNGYLVLTGFAAAADTSKSAWTIRMKDSVIVWNKKYYCPIAGHDAKAASLDLDSQANIYVTGRIYNGVNFDDLTLSYDTLGNVRWEKTFSLSSASNDVGNNIEVDSGGYIYVNGVSTTGTTNTYHTIRYSQAKTYDAPDSTKPKQQWAYYENMGQLKDTGNHQASYIHFYTKTSNPSLYVGNSALSYVFGVVDSTKDTLQRVDLTLQKSKSGHNINTSTVFSGSEQISPYLNYYIGGLPKYYENIHGYQRVTGSNIYPNIDWQLYSDSDGLKYYYVVNVGGTPSDIQFQYTGADSVKVDTTGLKIYTHYGKVKQKPFTAWQYTGSIATQISLTLVSQGSNAFTFTVGTYNTSLPLIITSSQAQQQSSCSQPIDNLEWSTYFGGNYSDIGTAIDATNADQFFTGFTQSSNFPGTIGIGANQILPAAFVAKFDSTNLLQWSVIYLGSQGAVPFIEPVSVAATEGDVIGNVLYIAGSTGYSDLPMPNMGSGALYNNTFIGNNSDMFIARFDPISGALQHATYIGSNNDDVASALVLNVSNNLMFLVGFTRGTNFPHSNSLTGGNFYDSTGTGVIIELSASGLVLRESSGFGVPHLNYNNIYATYGTEILDAKFDKDNNLLITGVTDTAFSYAGTSNFSGMPNIHSYTQGFNAPIGTRSAFVAKFTPDPSSFDGYQLYYYSLFGGSQQSIGWKICANSKDEIYMVGSDSCTGFPFAPSGSTCPSSSTSLFISKFSSDGVLEYSNIYGGSGTLTPSNVATSVGGGLLCDASDNLYIYGMTSPGSNINLSNRAGCYYDNNSGPSSPYELLKCAIIELDTAQNVVWATLFGCIDGNIAGGMSLDHLSNLYVCGGTGTNQEHANCSDNYPLKTETGATNYNPMDSASNNTGITFIAKFQIQNINPYAGINTVDIGKFLFKCYPNPSDGSFIVDMSGFGTGLKSMYIYDNIGRIVYSKQTLETKSQVAIEHLNTGIYYIKVSDADKSATDKLIITGRQ